MKYIFGNPAARNILIQPVGEHECAALERQAAAIREMSGADFCLVALKAEDWNRDLSPWKAPAVFGREDFGGGAESMLADVLAEVTDRKKKYYIGGYSLAGLFALWAAYQTDVFSGVAAASPSVWFPGFVPYMRENEIRTGRVYLSLGDREEKTRNPVMAAVGDGIRSARECLREKGVSCVLEWNPGNHFKDAEIRTAKAFAWVLKQGGCDD